MTDTEALLAAYDEQVRGRTPKAAPAGVRHERDGPLLRIVGRGRGFVSTLPGARPSGAELDRLVTAQRDHFAARGEAVEWKTYGHDEPAGLAERLRAAGFVPGHPMTVLIAAAADMAASPVLPDGAVIRRLTAEADLRRVTALECAVWGERWNWLGDWMVARVTGTPDDIDILAVEADGVLVSAAWIIYRPGTDFANLLGGTTLPAWRGRGVYRALVAHRARLATARGTRFLHVDASDDSAPILRRMGFHAVTTSTAHVWTPPASR